MMNKKTYQTARERATVILHNTALRLQEVLDREAKADYAVDAETAAIAASYAQVTATLLHLMKEESEETDHE